ncbi:Hypothetical protein MexAM1_META1p2471 [Methylorubrum extorquens AM1]|uniref:Uncharacterized protein n=1 Tax=Methylorubrum extorquens (strain ATCC 14718 / DSM 1338 / JCM 2805 / NCIMB 9133 / AM1) TaxID=272630 RepID=C5ARE1_METEA|nr:Hypothetical protein MexAM1_META1p2471 [Methylorubrum extorquens AM1]
MMHYFWRCPCIHGRSLLKGASINLSETRERDPFLAQLVAREIVRPSRLANKRHRSKVGRDCLRRSLGRVTHFDESVSQYAFAWRRIELRCQFAVERRF